MGVWKNIVDLSLPLSRTTPVYPGDPAIDLKEAKTIEKDRVNILSLKISTHHGTHFDAPFHQLGDGRTLDSFPPEYFVNKALKIDLTKTKEGVAKKAGIKYKQVITEKDLMPHDPHIRRAEALVLYTGYGRLLQEGLIDTDFPYLTGEAANYVHYFDNLRLIGIDSPTIDAYHEKAAHHGLFARPDVLVVETMVNLEVVPEWFTLLALPLLIDHSDGAPARVLAAWD